MQACCSITMTPQEERLLAKIDSAVPHRERTLKLARVITDSQVSMDISARPTVHGIDEANGGTACGHALGQGTTSYCAEHSGLHL